MRVTFSINQYDNDGDVFDKCILIHFENTIIRFENVEELEKFKGGLSKCIAEIKEQ